MRPLPQVLYVNDNQLDGALPEEIGRLTDLRYFNASDNHISGTIPASIGEMHDLNEFTMFENALTGAHPLPLPSPTNTCHVRDRRLRRNVSGEIPNELGKLYVLSRLMLNDNKLDGNLTRFEKLGDLRRLQILDLYNNNMTGALPASFRNLTALQRVFVDDIHLFVLRLYYCRTRIPDVGDAPIEPALTT